MSYINELTFKPVDISSRSDFEALFESKGGRNIAGVWPDG